MKYLQERCYILDVCHDFHSFFKFSVFSPAINIVPILYDDDGGDDGGGDDGDDLMIMMVVMMMVMITVLLPSLLLSSPIIAVISRMSNQCALI